MSNDSWTTPQWLFDKLDDEFGFSIDVCADEENAKCDLYFTEKQSCLIQDWAAPIFGGTPVSLHDLNRSCFMNPPYSKPRPFIEKAWEESKKVKVVCLVKVDPSTQWWATFWDYEKHQAKPGCQVRLLPKRVKFDPPPGWEGGTDGPSYASAVLVFDRRNIA